jgi:hypothetical protein
MKSRVFTDRWRKHEVKKAGQKASDFVHILNEEEKVLQTFIEGKKIYKERLLNNQVAA